MPNAFTRTFVPLLHREWLQYRFGWALLALLPLALALLMALVGQVEFDDGAAAHPHKLALMLALLPVVVAMGLMLVIGLISGLINVAGLARRDHADRSVAYWLSLPVPHASSLGVPMLAHLVLAPAVATLVGWLAGQALSLVLVGRTLGADALVEAPWGATLVATATLLLRILAGLPLAVLWLLPIVLLLVLFNAWFKRWGLVVLIVGFGLLGLVEWLSVGQRWLLTTKTEMLRHAVQALVGASGAKFNVRGDANGLASLLNLPAMAVGDFVAALAALGSPLFVGGLLFSAACFALLLRWRRSAGGVGD